MALNHSEETHANLLAKVPEVTGRDTKAWFQTLDDGPSLTRFDERVRWLQDEYEISHGMATTIVHESDLQKARRNL